jgi:hypothetical protein
MGLNYSSNGGKIRAQEKERRENGRKSLRPIRMSSQPGWGDMYLSGRGNLKQGIKCFFLQFGSFFA